jgi:hypothetical protein
MNKMSHWGKSIALGAFALGTLGNIEAMAAPPAESITANATLEQTQVSSSPNELQLAQGLVGQCRAANRTLDIFEQPSVAPDSETLLTIDPNIRVTLAGPGSEGWIAVSAPVQGYVIARHLKLCGDTPPPPPPPSTSNTCRRAQIDLSVRSNPSPFSANLGTVFNGQTLTLARPPRSEVGPQGRTWLQIAAPEDGWVSWGYAPNSLTNLGPAFTCR